MRYYRLTEPKPGYFDCRVGIDVSDGGWLVAEPEGRSPFVCSRVILTEANDHQIAELIDPATPQERWQAAHNFYFRPDSQVGRHILTGMGELVVRAEGSEEDYAFSYGSIIETFQRPPISSE